MSIGTQTLLLITTFFTAFACTFGGPTRERLFASVIPASDEEVAAPPEEVPTDRYGNEVRQAVARYKVDPAGVLYEEHSPDTEVPRLPAPKS